MRKYHRNRFVFLTFNVLKTVKFKKLERVSERIYIVVPDTEKEIPMRLVQQMQRIGNRIKWIGVHSENEEELNHVLSFYMGKLHETESRIIDFAVISNNNTLDTLVAFINSNGRNCLRVKHKSKKSTKISIESANFDIVPDPDIVTNEISDREIDRELIDETAKETLSRLVKSGNRPAEVSTLKSYILLHNKENKIHGCLDEVIRQLEKYDEIDIEEGEVSYNF